MNFKVNKPITTGMCNNPDQTVISVCQDLIYGMLELDPEKRFTAQEVMQHPWVSVRVYIHILSGALSILEPERFCPDICPHPFTPTKRNGGGGVTIKKVLMRMFYCVNIFSAESRTQLHLPHLNYLPSFVCEWVWERERNLLITKLSILAGRRCKRPRSPWQRGQAVDSQRPPGWTQEVWNGRHPSHYGQCHVTCFTPSRLCRS